MKIAHIGFGKTGTTALQLSLFPLIAAEFSLEYVNVDDLRIRSHVSRLIFSKPVDSPLSAQENFLVSAEDLHSWDPYFWDDWAEKNQRFLGSDCHVLITVRSPRSYLTSVYLQTCLHEGNVQSPNDFFLADDIYSPFNASAKFAIEKFGYEKIVAAYRARFQKVTIVKYESMGSALFLREFFDLTEAALSRYSESLRSTVVNKSFSARSVQLTFVLQKMLSLFGLSIEPNSVQGALIALGHLRRTISCKEANSCEVALASSITSRFSSYFRWPSLMHRMDRYFPAKRYELDFKALPQIDLIKLEDEYSKFPDIATFTNDFPSSADAVV